MGTGWRRAKKVLALHACATAPKDELPPQDSDAQQSSETETSKSDPPTYASQVSKTASRSASGLQLIRTSIRLSRSTCAICLEAMKPGTGHAFFTAECSHTFHFSCIASNVSHGNLVCPVCRAKWREVPWQAPVEVQKEQKLGANRTRRSLSIGVRQSASQHESARSGTLEAVEQMRRLDPVLRILDESIANARGIRGISPPEPNVFDDDEPLNIADGTSQGIWSSKEIRPRGSSNQEMPSTNSESMELVDNQAESMREMDVVERSGRELEERSMLETGVIESDNSEGSGDDSLIAASKAAAGEKLEESENLGQQSSISTKLEISCHAETNSIAYSKLCENFTVLVHLKAAAINKKRSPSPNEIAETDVNFMENNANLIREQSTLNVEQGRNHAVDNKAGLQSPILDLSSRAPLDLVTVLDVSGSMAGTKLLLLKRAMVFVIQNLSPADRLSVIAFSSTAKRLFPLLRMAPEGRQQALQAIDALVSTGGTDISQGLRKGAKVLKDRREHNPVASIMLLSDGQDTYSMGPRGRLPGSNYRHFVPGSLTHIEHGHIQIPVHTFGFGADHDAATMHLISEASGGTFSFIQAEGAVQDAFAQCIGGLLSVVVQEVHLSVSTHMQSIELNNIQAGSYESSITHRGRSGTVRLGYLYAEEERDILFELKIPALGSPPPQNASEMKILKVFCTYKDSVSQEICQTTPTTLSLFRPDHVDQEEQKVSLDVDRQRNRLLVAQTILETKSLADAANIEGAQQLLQNAKLALQRSEAFRSGDELSKVLETELNEIQERMASRQMYERLGRAYILSAQSSHFWQRATTRGESVDGHSRDYQTPSMGDMVLRSQTISLPTSSRSRSTTSNEICSEKPPSPTTVWMHQRSGRAV